MIKIGSKTFVKTVTVIVLIFFSACIFTYDYVFKAYKYAGPRLSENLKKEKARFEDYQNKLSK